MTRPNDTGRTGVGPGVDSTGSPEHHNQTCAFDRLLSGASDEAEQRYQLELYKGIRFLQNRWQSAPGSNSPTVANAAASVMADPNRGARPINQSLLRTLQIRQTQAHNELRKTVPGQAQAANTLSILADVNDSGLDDAPDVSSLVVIELTDRLFDYLLARDDLPELSKNLLTYLYAPLLKLALSDATFFERAEHPARMLLNSLVEASARWTSLNGDCQYDVYAKIYAIVVHLLAEFTHDTRVFADLHRDFNRDIQDLARRQALLEHRAVDKAQGEDTLRIARRRVYDEVQQRIQRRTLSSTVIFLLLQPWFDYLVFVFLRSGDSSSPWLQALQIIDELLYSLEPGQNSLEPLRAAKSSPDLSVSAAEILPMLERGLGAIDYDQTKGRTLLNAIQMQQTMAQQGREVAPAPASMRRKLEAIVAERTGIDALAVDEEAGLDVLQRVDAGAWIDTDEGERLKLAWQSCATGDYLLLDQRGRKVALVSATQLGRDLLTGKVIMVHRDNKVFFERALESIYQNLNACVGGNGGL